MTMRRSTQRGLTFLEIEIALLLLLLGVLAVIEISPLAMQGVRLAEQHAMAGQIAQHVLESEMARSFSWHKNQLEAVGSNGNSGDICSGAATAPDIQVPGVTDGTYRYEVSRARYPASYADGTATNLSDDIIVIAVEVRWRDPNARRYSAGERSLRIVGYKTE